MDGANTGRERVRNRKVWGTTREKRSRMMSGQKDGEHEKKNAPATVRKRIRSAEMKVFKSWKGNEKSRRGKTGI